MPVTEIRDAKAWRQKLSTCQSYDFYHTWDFHSISQRNGEGVPVMFCAGNEARGLLMPLLERDIPGTDLKDLTSVYGYPSPLVYGLRGDDPEVLNLWGEVVSALRAAGYVSVFSRGHPLLLPESLRGNYFLPISDVVVVDCRLDEAAQVAKYRTNHKRDIKKLRDMEAACSAGTGDDVLGAFISNYEATMDGLGAQEYYYFGENYYRGLLEAEDFSAEIWSCRLRGDVVASGIYVYCGEFVEFHLGGTNPEYYPMAPTKIIFDEVRRDAVKKALNYFVLGGGPGGKEGSLLRFKAGFSDRIEQFFVMKTILDHDAYERLSKGRSGEFFPLYRSA